MVIQIMKNYVIKYKSYTAWGLKANDKRIQQYILVGSQETLTIQRLDATIQTLRITLHMQQFEGTLAPLTRLNCNPRDAFN